MKKNERLFNRVAPMGVNDIMMAVQYQHAQSAPLDLPLVAFDGLSDYTIDRGNMEKWEEYTQGSFKLVPVQGDHYFVSSHYRMVISSLSSSCALFKLCPFMAVPSKYLDAPVGLPSALLNYRVMHACIIAYCNVA